MCWLCGQYLAARILVILTVSCVVILFCISCYNDYGNNIKGCVIACCNYLLYKNAEVVPVQLAIETNRPANSIAIPIQTTNVVIIN